jgi:glycosyltransferase involved in cell wall biosynthesis
MRWALLSQVWVEEAEGTVTGSSVQVYYLAQELVRRGEEVLVLLSGHRRAWERTEGRLRLVSLPAYSAGLWGWLQPRWQRDAEAVLRAFRPDVVYQRGKLPETVLAARYVQRSRAVFVWSSNADNSAYRWKYVRKRLRWRRRPWWMLPLRLAEAAVADLLIERALQRAHLLLAQTHHQQRTLELVLKQKAHLVGSGHPLPPPPRSKPSPPAVLWLANVTPMKRPHLFVRLARALQGSGAHFLMAGAAPDRHLLEAVLQDADGLPNFRYVGAVPFLQTAELFAQASLFVLTSELEFEGLPNTLIQACLHGVPVISLGNDPDGILSRYGVGEVVADEHALVRSVASWLADEERRHRAAERAYQLACERFDIARVVGQLMELVEQALH